MPDNQSPRLGLPYLFAAQAQKEITHNESLALIDALLHPVIQDESAAPASGLTTADAGKCWLIANGGSAEWQDRDLQIAYWTGGSWRFLLPVSGMQLWDLAAGCIRHFRAGVWSTPDSIPDASGGITVDTEARATISQLLARLRDIGLVAV